MQPHPHLPSTINPRAPLPIDRSIHPPTFPSTVDPRAPLPIDRSIDLPITRSTRLPFVLSIFPPFYARSNLPWPSGLRGEIELWSLREAAHPERGKRAWDPAQSLELVLPRLSKTERFLRPFSFLTSQDARDDRRRVGWLQGESYVYLTILRSMTTGNVTGARAICTLYTMPSGPSTSEVHQRQRPN